MTLHNQRAHEENLSDEAMKELAEAFETFTRTTQTLEESYRRLELRLKDVDQELAEKNRELAFTGDYLNSLLESMSDGVIAIDQRGVVTTFNRAAGAVLGYAREDIVGRGFREVFGRDFGVPEGRHVMELKAKDGRAITVSERDSPMSGREGHRIGTVKVFQDLTEIEELRKQLRRKDRLAAIGEMAATVAHEIRNPLGGIRGFAALLERDLEGQESLHRLVAKILMGARDLERVVDELLEYTRPIELRLRHAKCADLVEAAMGYLKTDGRAIEIDNNVDPALEFMADPDRVRQVFLNILLNAVQSIEDAGEVGVTAKVEGDSIAIMFTDSGCGMTPDQVEQVFSPFFTTKEKGTGLGMAVAAKIVEIHGGSLEAQSEPGCGSTFTVRLPKGQSWRD